MDDQKCVTVSKTLQKSGSTVYVPYICGTYLGMNKMNPTIKTIINALNTIKISNKLNETQIHNEIKKVLQNHSIKFIHEYKIYTGKRFDFWVNGIVLEVKKQKPTKINLLNQLNRYTKVPGVKAIIVVLEKNINIPKEINSKPIIIKSLNENWGITV